MSILSLPIDQQKKIAAEHGVSFDAWVLDIQNTLDNAKAYEELIKDKPASKLWANPEFQKRVDSENILTFG